MKLTDVLTSDGDALFVVGKGGREVTRILRVRDDLFVSPPGTVDVQFAEPGRPRKITVTAGWNAKEWKALPADHPVRQDQGAGDASH